MANVLDVANFILKLSREDCEDGEYELISHMKLQKLIYYCQGFHLAFYDVPLFPDPIVAWEHGPVCQRLYHVLKGYGASPISAISDGDSINLTKAERDIITLVYGKYGQYSASKLRQMTHNEAPWSNTLYGNNIDQNVMKRYFSNLITVSPDNIPSLTQKQKDDVVRILEEAEAHGEIDLSQFCTTVEEPIPF
jgi:uncharacterized phage-associated protein